MRALVAVAALAFLTLLLLTGCGASGATSSGSAKDTVTVKVALENSDAVLQVTYPKVLTPRDDRYYPTMDTKMLQGSKKVHVNVTDQTIVCNKASGEQYYGLDFDSPVLEAGQSVRLDDVWFQRATNMDQGSFFCTLGFIEETAHASEAVPAFVDVRSELAP